MPVHDALGTRMKEYERRNQYYLQRRTPVAIRVDGRAFHSYTKGLNRPFDNIFQNTMIQTMETLCEQIQNCIFGYVQSDEITFILKDYTQLNTSAWFEYRTDKLCSISASLATYYFNKYFAENANRIISADPTSSYSITLSKCINEKAATFDARCFNIPKEEVVNLVYWRQLDAVRNSILSCGQAEFSHKELMNKSCKEIKTMLEDIGKSWDKIPIYKQRGTACRREEGTWVTDYSMPLLLKEDRAYLEDLI